MLPNLTQTGRLRVAAIEFLNPVPLLWNFEHKPVSEMLQTRYDVSYTLPSLCAEKLRDGTADLGLVPIAALPFLTGCAAVPGCVIASQNSVRSIQFVLRPGFTPATVKTIAADAASRSSTTYLRAMLQTFYNNTATCNEEPASLRAMLLHADAALLIGDAALLALEERDRNGAFADCTWIDLATMWNTHTGLPWVAAVWAVNVDALARSTVSRETLIADLTASRDAGTANVDAIAEEWRTRLPLSAGSIHDYLTRNIAYTLDARCMQAMDRFFTVSTECGLLPSYDLRML